jgi:hypothetical protein
MLLEKHVTPIPDIAVVAIDANCRKYAEAVQDIGTHVKPVLSGRVVTACPDPHVERWYMADPESFTRVVGASPRLPRSKCERGFYKNLLVEAVRKAGRTLTLGGIEFAPEIVEAMDFDRASRRDRALSRFISDARAALRSSRP